MSSREDLKRLGRLVVARRSNLGIITRAQFIERTGLSQRTLTSLERGLSQLKPSTYAIIERALHWRAGSVEQILAGGMPVELVGPVDTRRDLSWASDTVLIAELERRLARRP